MNMTGIDLEKPYGYTLREFWELGEQYRRRLAYDEEWCRKRDEERAHEDAWLNVALGA
jgi:hypothetical protein